MRITIWIRSASCRSSAKRLRRLGRWRAKPNLPRIEKSGVPGLFSEAIEPGMLLLNACRKATNPAPVAAAWEAIERLLRDLQGRGQPSEQIRCTLRAPLDGLVADLVFWSP